MIFKPINSLSFPFVKWKQIKQPSTNQIIPITNIKTMVVPLIGFNKSNHRLGYGMNFYNDYLHQPNNIHTIGLAYRFQRNNHFITTDYDKILHQIVTN